MRFFIDTADINAIKELADLGLVDGITTNPSLIAKSGKNFLQVIAEICAVVAGPVSAEVAATDYLTMMQEGLRLHKIAPNVVVKLPLTIDGLKACRTLTHEHNIETNVTLCFSASQALLAAKSGATYISPFVGRLDDIAQDGMELIQDISTIYKNYGFKTQILVASIRHPIHITRAAKIGAHVATIPPNVAKQLIGHPLTDKGLENFISDWKATGQSIL